MSSWDSRINDLTLNPIILDDDAFLRKTNQLGCRRIQRLHIIYLTGRYDLNVRPNIYYVVGLLVFNKKMAVAVRLPPLYGGSYYSSVVSVEPEPSLYPSLNSFTRFPKMDPAFLAFSLLRVFFMDDMLFPSTVPAFLVNIWNLHLWKLIVISNF